MNNRNILSLCIGAVLFSSGAFASNVELSELYRDSLENNPALRAAAYEIESAQRQHDQINGLYRPQLDASIAYGALRNDWTTLTETDSHGLRFLLVLDRTFLIQSSTLHLVSQSVVSN